MQTFRFGAARRILRTPHPLGSAMARCRSGSWRCVRQTLDHSRRTLMVRIAIAGFAVVALAWFVLARGQSGSVESSPPLREDRAPAQRAGQVTVFAAASLTDAFTEIGERFKADNPGSDITFNFGASSQLFVQI